MCVACVPIYRAMNRQPHHRSLLTVVGMLSLLAALLPCQLTADDKVLHVSADTWMPFNGDPQGEKPGYVVEILKTVFEPAGIKVDYSTMEYAAALEKARAGQLDAVIGPDEGEAKGLILPKQSIGQPSICLLATANTKAEYQNIRSLKTLKLGVIEGYTYWDALDTHIAAKKNISEAAGDTPLTTLFTRLEKGEIDVIVETESVLLWFLRENKRDKGEFKALYRHEAEPIYVAFSNDEKGKSFAALFDKGMETLRKGGELKKILARYGLREWE